MKGYKVLLQPRLVVEIKLCLDTFLESLPISGFMSGRTFTKAAEPSAEVNPVKKTSTK